MAFDYFYGQQAEQFAFYRIPKVLYTDDRFKYLSSEAKTLYGIMLDRMSLSMKNGWMDDQGRVYIIFTTEQVMEAMNCADKKATRLMQELEDKAGLIARKRQGQGKPSLIYVKNFISVVDNSGERRFKNRQNNDSRVVETTIPDPSKQRCNKTDNNKTEYSETDPIISADSSGWDKDEMEERRSYEIYFRKELQIPWLIERNPSDADALEGIVNIMVDVMTAKRKFIRISSDDKPAEVVKSRFMKLSSEHISYVLQCLSENTTRVKNPKAYLLAALYNAPDTIGTYFQSWVNNDMANGLI